MNDNDFLNSEELEYLLSPRCEFHASDSLKDKIVGQTGIDSGSSFKRYFRYADVAAACIAAIIFFALIPQNDIDREKQAKLVENNIKKQDSVSVENIKHEPSTQVLAFNHLKQPNTLEHEKSLEKEIKSKVQKLTTAKHQLTTDDQQSTTDDQQWSNEEPMIFAMISEEESHIIPMTPSPDEIIRRQEESTLEYIAYMRQEIEYAQQLIKQQYEINQIHINHE